MKVRDKLNHKMNTYTCSICYTEETVKKTIAERKKCDTCIEGYICVDCIPHIDPVGSIFLPTRRKVEKAIRCPCCRTLNWKYHYSQILDTTLGYDLEMYEEYDNPATRIYIKNTSL